MKREISASGILVVPMHSRVYVFDPTAADELSRVRGIGRYLQTLHENFQTEFTFVDQVAKINPASIFINPFFNPLTPPLTMQRIAEQQIAVIHDLIPLKYPQHFPIGIRGRLFLFLNKQTFRHYNLIITDSEASKADIIRLFTLNSDRVRVVYPTTISSYFDKPQISPTESHNLPPFSYYIYVGDATWNKNLVTIARAIQLADVKCIFVGNVFTKKFSPSDLRNTWLLELRKFQEITKNDRRFVFPGFVNDADLRSLYGNAIGNILISRDEGFGLSYLEAATCGVPTVAASTSIQKEIAAGAASFSDPDSVEQIRDALLLLKNNREIRDRIGLAAKKRSTSFRPEIFKKNLLEAIDY